MLHSGHHQDGEGEEKGAPEKEAGTAAKAEVKGQGKSPRKKKAPSHSTRVPRGLTLGQLDALVDIAGAFSKPMMSGGLSVDELEKRINSVERLEQILGCEILTTAPSKDAGQRSDSDQLTEIGMELLEMSAQFFDALEAITATKHGRSIRIASSVTLGQWLVSPSYPRLQERVAQLALRRPPDFSFSEINRREVPLRLASRAFHFIVLRKASDLTVSRVGDTFRHGDEDPLATEERLVAQWAAATDDQYKKWLKSHPFGSNGAHARRRFALVLGQYDYITFLRKGQKEELEALATRTRKPLRHFLEVALCTNHPEFHANLRDLEKRTGLHVAVRTDSWVQSAQMALQGGYATFLPAIAQHALKELEPIHLEDVPSYSEQVLLIFNPTILHTQLYRQMLEAFYWSIRATLDSSLKPTPTPIRKDPEPPAR